MDDETKKRIAEIRAREQEATKAPWSRKPGWNNGGIATSYFKIPGNNLGEVVEMISEDAIFIVHARQDVPFLLDALEKAEKDREQAERRVLCDVLERLGADGAWYTKSNMSVEDLHAEIVNLTRASEAEAVARMIAKTT